MCISSYPIYLQLFVSWHRRRRILSENTQSRTLDHMEDIVVMMTWMTPVSSGISKKKEKNREKGEKGEKGEINNNKRKNVNVNEQKNKERKKKIRRISWLKLSMTRSLDPQFRRRKKNNDNNNDDIQINLEWNIKLELQKFSLRDFWNEKNTICYIELPTITSSNLIADYYNTLLVWHLYSVHNYFLKLNIYGKELFSKIHTQKETQKEKE